MLQVAVSDGTTTKVSSTTSSVTIERNKIYNITFAGKAITGEAAVSETAGISGNKAAWVQLWAGGPKFAAFNVGATITDYKYANSTSSTKSEKYKSPDYVGGYYGWGGSTTCSSSEYYNETDYDSNGNLKSDYDTATKLWGDSWCMPTQAQLNKLRNYNDDGSAALSSLVTTWTWCSGESGSQYVSGCTLAGYKVSGVGAYSSNSVFFPAAGYYISVSNGVSGHGSYGFCWSATPNGSYNACVLNFYSSTQYVDQNVRYYGCSVRAVLKE